MRRMGMAIAALAVALTAGAGRAGVYDLDDPLPPRYPPLPTYHDQIRLVLAPLRAAGVPPPAEPAEEPVRNASRRRWSKKRPAT